MQLEDNLFALRLIPNPNLIMELCSRSASLEVLEPKELREAVRSALKTALKPYED